MLTEMCPSVHCRCTRKQVQLDLQGGVNTTHTGWGHGIPGHKDQPLKDTPETGQGRGVMDAHPTGARVGGHLGLHSKTLSPKMKNKTLNDLDKSRKASEKVIEQN
jgi:hypothetical protein